MEEQELCEQKKTLRRRIHALSEGLDPAERSRADRAIEAAILESEEWKSAGAVFSYVSMADEPDTRGLIEAALREGKTVFVPHCYPDRTMKAVRIESLDALAPGTLGIPEPVDDSVSAAPGEIGLALVPCVSAARDGRRLGHGAGYYDRFLADRSCRTLCLCYEALLCDEIPTDALDVPMDAVVSEKGIYDCKRE